VNLLAATYTAAGRSVEQTAGTGHPLVFLHASGLALQDALAFLTGPLLREFQSIAFDRPGYGHSEWPAGENLTLSLNARLLHSALRQLRVENPVLLGHSTGGSVALRYAIEYPDEIAGLVLLAPTCYAAGLSLPKLEYLTETPVLAPLFLETLYVPATELRARSWEDCFRQTCLRAAMQTR
jgi:pimeloyl-ACP methyl ester carboxylesterase